MNANALKWSLNFTKSITISISQLLIAQLRELYGDIFLMKSFSKKEL